MLHIVDDDMYLNGARIDFDQLRLRIELAGNGAYIHRWHNDLTFLSNMRYLPSIDDEQEAAFRRVYRQLLQSLPR